jgi:hypothetical protein
VLAKVQGRSLFLTLTCEYQVPASESEYLDETVLSTSLEDVMGRRHHKSGRHEPQDAASTHQIAMSNDDPPIVLSTLALSVFMEYPLKPTFQNLPSCFQNTILQFSFPEEMVISPICHFLGSLARFPRNQDILLRRFIPSSPTGLLFQRPDVDKRFSVVAEHIEYRFDACDSTRI